MRAVLWVRCVSVVLCRAGLARFLPSHCVRAANIHTAFITEVQYHASNQPLIHELPLSLLDLRYLQYVRRVLRDAHRDWC